MNRLIVDGLHTKNKRKTREKTSKNSISQPPGIRGGSKKMQVLQGTKREITIIEWQEQLEKYMKRANDCMECFRLYHNSDDLIHLSEDCEKLIELCNHAKEAIEFMDAHNIK